MKLQKTASFSDLINQAVSKTSASLKTMEAVWRISGTEIQKLFCHSLKGVHII